MVMRRAGPGGYKGIVANTILQPVTSSGRARFFTGTIWVIQPLTPACNYINFVHSYR